MKRIVNISCKLILCATMGIALSAQTFTTIHSFDGTDGKYPYAGLIQANNGDGYGTTENGGTSTNCNGGCGTVFKITPGGTLKTLYSFCAQSGCPDGQYPYAGLFQDANGDFYGTTAEGGASGFGTIFRITPTALTTLHSFDGTDGENPLAGLIQGADGNFYGTTVNGGVNKSQGTVFKMTPGGMLTTLYSFCEQGVLCPDGAAPLAGLVQAANGDFYGVTVAGGANDGGTVFKITSSGTLTTLYSFCAQTGCTDGKLPYAGLVQAPERALLRDNVEWRGQRRWHGFPNHARWRADNAIQLLLPNRVRGRLIPRCGAGPGHRRQLLRDYIGRRGQRRWHGFRDHPQPRHVDGTAQLYGPQRSPHSGAGPGYQWGLLRDNLGWRDRR
jgi:uncharacterized repeat protein (TIGR03803 family)